MSIFTRGRTADQIAVERAMTELRAGRAVAIPSGADFQAVVGVDALDEAMLGALEPLARRQVRLLLPAPRLRRLGLDRDEPGAVALPRLDAARIGALAFDIDARIDAPVSHLGPLDAAALELARLTLIAPAVVVLPLAAGVVREEGLATVATEAILAYREADVRDLHIVARGPAPLEGASEAEFVVFRGGDGLRDQVAVIIGRPDLSRPVTVRLHSACLTGDLFGSLKCDCGDQLRATARAMAKDGGVLLYLDQEGRGNGIANKMRAYHLQAQGFDTFDADEALGFGHDQRFFDFAASMLKTLGVVKVDLLTNNPLKIDALRAAGLDVASRRILGRTTDQNMRYLAAKRERAGHLIDFDALKRDVDGAPE